MLEGLAKQWARTKTKTGLNCYAHSRITLMETKFRQMNLSSFNEKK